MDGMGVVPVLLECCASPLLMHICCWYRLEAPRYRRVSPVGREAQKLIITKEVGFFNGYQIAIVLWSHLFYKSKSVYHRCKRLLCSFYLADGVSSALCCGSSVEEHHLHTGALWQLHRAPGKAPPEHLQVRTDGALTTPLYPE